MTETTDDIRIEEIKPLISPQIVMNSLPLEQAGRAFVTESRRDSEAILGGKDDRVLVVVGPCSIHDHGLALEYADRLAGLISKYEDDLQILMRVYFEKPRTTVGWKGYINDPDLDGSCDINRGLRLARELLVELAEKRIGAATEFLDVITPQYIADIVAWGAIGARTTESQVHRQLASGLSMPVGFKNGTDGNLKIAVDAVGAARGKHSFLSVTKQGVSAIVETAGNPHCHVILRGASAGPNYDAGSVSNAVSQLQAAGLPPHLMVDCSHGNSLKDHNRQPLVNQELCTQISEGSEAIVGVMIESHLVAGNQNVVPGATLVHGQSITDACVDWATTEAMLEALALAVRARRKA
jgi:3-deoxy-7-phosphoheptulonate synthase